MRYIFILIFFAGLSSASSQNYNPRSDRDTTILDTVETDTAASQSSNSGSAMSKSPTGAIVRSLILPGWGQLYVESYWKAPLMAGAFGTTAGIMIWNHNQYVDAQNRLKAYEGDDQRELSRLQNERSFYRDQRDLTGLYLLGVYIISAVDAYVGAHLYDFDVGEDLSLNIKPGYFGSVSLNFSYNF